MAENQPETSDESFNDGAGGQEADKKDGSNMSLERKDSLKRKTMKKHGHLRVKEDGQLTYKRTPSSALMLAIQLGIGYSVGRLTAKQERDILMQDFSFVEKVWFPSSGSRETPSHRFQDFKFKSYAPSAFRYFRDLFGMQPSEFLMALSIDELREVSNPGASGSLFFLSADDNFIIKTVQHKEATFLQQLLPGYYMNIHQNQRTLLPKFFGLYCYQSQNVNIRLVVMNNILKTTFKCHQLYDLKGSTFKRKASKAELSKKIPTKKDLDFRTDYNEGITLDADLYDLVVKTIKRDCRVLESFKIMDYSLLLGIHNMDQAEREKENATSNDSGTEGENPERIARREEFGAALEAIQYDKEGRPLGGIPATSPNGDRLILFFGIIDILQSYRLGKKLEHGWKSLIHDGDSVSVHNPSFYAKRFIEFMADKVFKKASLAGGRGAARRRSNKTRTATSETITEPAPADSGVQKPKEGRQKSASVKFSEMNVIYDNDSQDQMVPPPYDTQIHKKNDIESVGTQAEQVAGDDESAAVHISTTSDTERSGDSEISLDTEKSHDIDRSRDTEKPRDAERSDDPNTGNDTEPSEASTEVEVKSQPAMEASGVTEMTVERYLKERQESLENKEESAKMEDGSHIIVESNAMEASRVTEMTVERYLKERKESLENKEESSKMEDGSHIIVESMVHELSEVEAPAHSIGGTVTYSSSSTVVTSTMSYKTVITKHVGKETATTVTQSKFADGDLPEIVHYDGAIYQDSELEERSGLNHVEVKGDSSEVHITKGDGSKVSEDSGVEVTNIDTLIAETVAPTDVKLDVPVTDSYEVNGVMVTKI